MKMQSCDQNESQVSTSSMMFCNYIDADTNNQKNSAIYHTGASFAKSLQLLPKSYCCASQPISTRCARNDARFFWNFPDKFRGENNYRCVCIYVYVYMYISIYIYMIYIYIRVYTHIISISYCIILYTNTYVSPVCTTDLLTWHAFMVVASSQKSIKQLSFQQQKHLLLLMVQKSHSQPPKECKEPCFYDGRNYHLQVVSKPDFWTINSITRTPGGNTAKMFWEFSIWTDGRRFWTKNSTEGHFLHNLIMSISGCCSW